MRYSEQQLKHSLQALRDNMPAMSPERERAIRERVMSVVYREARQQETMPVSFYIRVRTLAKLFIPQNVWRFALQPAFVMVLVLGVGTSGWITSVQAASNSLPGDVLYPIKIASERTQVALASLSEDGRAVTGLRVAFAKRRLDEVKRVVRTPDSKKKAARAATAMQGFKKEITSLHDSLKQVQASQTETATELAKAMQARNAEFTAAISEAHKAAAVEDPLIAHELKTAEQLVDQTTLTALGVLVQKHAAGDPLVREKDVAGAVGDQLEKARAEVNVFVEKEGVGRDAKKKVAQVVREAEQLIEQRSFDGALERVRAIQEIAKAGDGPAAGQTQEPVSFTEAITRVLKNVTSTIIGESR